MEEKKNDSVENTPLNQARADLQAEMSDPELIKLMKEETIESPGRTILKTFLSNKLSIVALVVFFIILLAVIIGPIVYPVDLSFVEVTQQNIAPTTSFLNVPDALKKADNVLDISAGRSYSVGLDKQGKLYIWGETTVPGANLKASIPKDLPALKKISAGFDHVVAISQDGKFVSWGNNRLRQSRPTPNLKKATDLIDVQAYHQATLVLGEDGTTYFLGNSNLVDYYDMHEWQGQIKQIALNGEACIGLLEDGTPVYLGTKTSAYSKFPEGVKFKKIAGGAKTFAGIGTDNKIYVWGNPSFRGDGKVPEELTGSVEAEKKPEGTPIDIVAGQYHYVVLMDNGQTYAWGDNTYKQANVGFSDAQKIYSGYYQNYIIEKNGNVSTSGLKGYVLGSDEFGRDVWQRMLNGGRWTMTIGAVAVLISTIIGIIIGGVSGYFGGAVDMILQRLSEIVGSLPFLPFAIILNAIIGNKLNPTQRVYLIMIVLGLLSWTGLQRLVRAQVFSVREQEYVTAARSLGIKETSIIFSHIIPNVISTIIVSTTLSFASSMLSESSLSFLGFGVQPPIPTWGNMLFGANNSVVIQNYWWRWVFPSIALALTVISINLIGDGLRDAIDPRSQGR